MHYIPVEILYISLPGAWAPQDTQRSGISRESEAIPGPDETAKEAIPGHSSCFCAESLPPAPASSNGLFQRRKTATQEFHKLLFHLAASSQHNPPLPQQPQQRETGANLPSAGHLPSGAFLGGTGHVEDSRQCEGRTFSPGLQVSEFRLRVTCFV